MNLMTAEKGTNRNFLEIFFVSALGKNDVKQSAYVLREQLAPYAPEPRRRHLGISDRVNNRSMAQVSL